MSFGVRLVVNQVVTWHSICNKAINDVDGIFSLIIGDVKISLEDLFQLSINKRKEKRKRKTLLLFGNVNLNPLVLSCSRIPLIHDHFP
jgi:hypothetical protein